MKLTIVGYDRTQDSHNCENEKGDIIKVDLMTSGELEKPEFYVKEKYFEWCESLVGKKIKVNQLHTYVAVADKVEIIE